MKYLFSTFLFYLFIFIFLEYIHFSGQIILHEKLSDEMQMFQYMKMIDNN